jgi:hypothetical protein
MFVHACVCVCVFMHTYAFSSSSFDGHMSVYEDVWVVCVV